MPFHFQGLRLNFLPYSLKSIFIFFVALRKSSNVAALFLATIKEYSLALRLLIIWTPCGQPRDSLKGFHQKYNGEKLKYKTLMLGGPARNMGPASSIWPVTGLIASLQIQQP
ncbi:hypothetical protein ColLi_10146 [Colletotrichum liriopes]|uniref:Uncharacterized protein n=1 Tax=Colletotrichum liriopes TaxID=708192 RepID=A0AA37GWB7_9PEZI|nr:hypothetical protein ColLi_10146 [Colletotrichum liriopes]